MNIFTIGDLHLSFAPDSNKPMDVFGEKWKDHYRKLERNWRKLIEEEDIVVVPGDISWGLKLSEAKYDFEWIDRLPGKKIFLKGNHDLWWAGITKLNQMYESITFLQNDAYETELGWICGSRGWITPADEDFAESDEKVYRRELLRLRASLDLVPEGEEIIGFLHYPPALNPRCHSEFMDIFEAYEVRNVYYGHLHGEDAFKKAIQGRVQGVNYHLVSADYLNFCPLLVKKGD